MLCLPPVYLGINHIFYSTIVWKLLESVDKRKDQTYFLSTLSQVELCSVCVCVLFVQRVLEKVVFPIGILKKSEVKQIAIDAGFADIAAKKEVYSLAQ